MQNREAYTQISLFADQDTTLDGNGRKSHLNIRDHSKRLVSNARFSDLSNRRCVYEVCEQGKPPYCQVAKMATDKNRIQPDEPKCGTPNCPYFISINKEN